MDVSHLDEAGVSPTLPPSYGWSPVGESPTVPYEAAQGRRINAVGAYFSDGPSAGRFVFETRAALPKKKKGPSKRSGKKKADAGAVESLSTDLPRERTGSITGEVLVDFIWHKVAGRPQDAGSDWKRPVPLTIILDNYSVHHGAAFKEQKPAWEAANIQLLYLPPYSPELSEIEPIWNDVKHHDMQKRSYSEIGQLQEATDKALARKAERLQMRASESNKLLCGTT